MTVLRWVLVVCAVLKGLDARLADPALGQAWLVTAVLLAVHERAGAALLAVVAFGGAAFDLYRMSNHVVFLGWVGAILACWGDTRSRLALLRTQLVVLYAFAGFSKINPDFLSGAYVTARQAWIPMPSLLAFVVIALEWTLALAVWRRHPWTLPMAAVAHLSILATWTTDFWGHGPGLLVFNAAVVAVVAVVVPMRQRHRVSAPPDAETAVPHGPPSGYFR